MSNTQRVAVITGASQGIGDGLVSGFRKLGYAVVANSRTIDESDDPMVLTVPGDISQPGVGQRIIDAALERFGRIDTVVNNAGIFIALGIIRTPMHDASSYDALAKLHPVGRLGDIEDVVDAVLYLENAVFVTGEILHVDGGQSAGH